jgi:Metallo-peptidase family M12B Reprolysin-like
MRVGNRRLLIPVVVVAGLFVPGVPAASGANAPTTAQRITGVVQTLIREQPPDQRAPVSNIGLRVNDTTRVLRVGTQIVPLTDGSLPTTKDGARVSLTVVPGGDGTKRVVSATTISAPAAAATPTTHQVYVALVVPANIPADTSVTEASARAMVTTVSRYWSGQTGGNVSFVTAQVLPAYRSSYGCPSTDTSTGQMWAEALARMPEAYGPGKHLVLVAPAGAYSHGCFYGLGTIGALEAEGNQIFVSGLTQSLLAHELGHNLGLYHSNSLRCNGTQDMPMVSLGFPGCQPSAYDDMFDVMGYSGATYGEGNLNAVHLDGMGLLPSAVRTIAANSGVTTARITPLSTSTGNRTLKIADPSGASYFVEYRTSSGLDTVASRNPWRPAWGVRVLRDDPQAPPSAGSYELDATPTSLTGRDYNRSIPVGGTFTAASRKLTIRVAAQDATGATLTITNWDAPVVPFMVTQSVPTPAWVGTVIAALTRVTDQHGRAVAGWPVTLQRMPKGSTTWQLVYSLRTTSTGAASVRFANGLSGTYRWVTGSATGAPARISPVAGVTSIARVFENRTVTSTRYRTYVSVSGLVSAVPAPVVYLQYRVGAGPWRTTGRAAVRGTTVSARIAMNVRGNVYTRFYIRTAASYTGSISNCYLTTVR